MLACPLDHEPLQRGPNAWRCPAGHSYDVAREGYVNLLPPGKPSRAKAGDDVEAIHARRRFLDAGHYEPLAAYLAATTTGAVADIGCGEGYYTSQLRGEAVVGVDLSRAGIRLAARRYKTATFVVGNGAALPLVTGSVEVAVSAFAPVWADEFARVVAPGGRVVIAIPGAHHLAALRALLYEAPLPHDEAMPLADDARFVHASTDRITGEITLDDVTDIVAMTPYRFAVPPSAIDRALAAPTPFTTPVEFVVATFLRQ